MEIKRLVPDDILLAEKTIRQLKLDPGKSDSEFDNKFLAEFLNNPRNFLITALSGNEPAGLIICYELERVDREKPMMLLYEINVLKNERRKGIAKAMINYLKKICKNKNAVKMWGVTNLYNEAAVNLFKTAGAQIIKNDDSIIFTYI